MVHAAGPGDREEFEERKSGLRARHGLAVRRDAAGEATDSTALLAGPRIRF